jgi:hypothetical protein
MEGAARKKHRAEMHAKKRAKLHRDLRRAAERRVQDEEELKMLEDARLMNELEAERVAAEAAHDAAREARRQAEANVADAQRQLQAAQRKLEQHGGTNDEEPEEADQGPEGDAVVDDLGEGNEEQEPDFVAEQHQSIEDDSAAEVEAIIDHTHVEEDLAKLRAELAQLRAMAAATSVDKQAEQQFKAIHARTQFISTAVKTLPQVTHATLQNMPQFWADVNAALRDLLGPANNKAPLRGQVIVTWLRQGTANSTLSTTWDNIRVAFERDYPPYDAWTDEHVIRLQRLVDTNLPIALPALEAVAQQVFTTTISSDSTKFLRSVSTLAENISTLLSRIQPDREQGSEWPRAIIDLAITAAFTRDEHLWRVIQRVNPVEGTDRRNGVLITNNAAFLQRIQNELMSDQTRERKQRRDRDHPDDGNTDSVKKPKSDAPNTARGGPGAQGPQGGGGRSFGGRAAGAAPQGGGQGGPRGRGATAADKYCSHHGWNPSHASGACRSIHRTGAVGAETSLSASASAPTPAPQGAAPYPVRSSYMGRGNAPGGSAPGGSGFRGPPPRGGPSPSSSAPSGGNGRGFQSGN